MCQVFHFSNVFQCIVGRLNPYLDHTATQLFHKLAPLFLLHIFVFFAVAPSDDGGSEIVSYSLEVNSGQGNVYVLLR